MFLVHVTYNSFSNKNIKTLFLASGYQEDIKILSRQSCIFQNGRCWGSMACTAKSHLNYSEIVLICTSGMWEQKIVEDHLVSFSFRMLSLFQMHHVMVLTVMWRGITIFLLQSWKARLLRPQPGESHLVWLLFPTHHSESSSHLYPSVLSTKSDDESPKTRDPAFPTSKWRWFFSCPGPLS